MPRDFSSGFQSALQEEVLHLSVLVKLTRLDGYTLGFTDADSPIIFGGLTYEPTDGLGVSSIQSAAGSGVDTQEALGSVSSDRITESDLSAGVWQGARFEVRLVHRDNVALGAPVIHAGNIGEIHIVGSGTFQAELRSKSHLLKQSVGEQATKLCTCRRLGDACCKVNMSGTARGFPIRATRILASGAGSTLTFASDGAPSDHYRFGTVKFLTGPNAGIERDVKAHSFVSGSAVVTLRDAFPFPVSSGESARLEAGCSREFAMCNSDFGNANNFHGLPFLPGNDAIQKRGRGAAGKKNKWT